MKNFQTDKLEINISVIGLSGGEILKGKKGVGKSCLCNRLAQPNNYKSSHNFVIELNETYNNEIKNIHWLSWGSIVRENKGITLQLQFIEQTVMIENISDCNIDNGKIYIDCATSIEFSGLPKAHIVGPIAYRIAQNYFKTSVDLFLLVYDVSMVEGRDPNCQDIFFKRLFDKIITTRLPIIVASTKHDIASPDIVDRLSAIIGSYPYCLYPVVETSASLGVNIDTIIDLATVLCQDGIGAITNRPLSYEKALSVETSNHASCIEDLRRIALSILSDDGWQASWTELRRQASVCMWMERLGSNVVVDIFEKVRMEIRLDQRASSIRLCRDKLCELLSGLNGALNMDNNRDVQTVINGIINDPVFERHFVAFHQDLEYFDFAKNAPLLPQNIIDEKDANNLLSVIKDFIDQRSLEEQLVQRLLEHRETNSRKTVTDVGEDLRNEMNIDIDEKIITNAYMRFQKQYRHIIECQFLEILHEKISLFMRLDLTKLKEEHLSVSASFQGRIIKEINSKISFPPLSSGDDKDGWRLYFIDNYLTFLLSEDQNECIDVKVRHWVCSTMMILDHLAGLIKIEPTVSNQPHVFFIVIIGNDHMTKLLTDDVKSFINTSFPGSCKVHNVKYEVKVLRNIDSLEELQHKDHNCNEWCILLCHEEDNKQPLNTETPGLIDQRLNRKPSIYIVYDVSALGIRIKPIHKWSIDEPRSECEVVQISDLITRCQSQTDPSIVWIVMVCGDTYEYKTLLQEVVDNLQRHSDPKQVNDGFISICGCFTSQEIDRENYRICFISYHQAIKLLIKKSPSPPIDGLILACFLDRLASVNACIAIGEYLPKELRSRCHCLLLGIPGRANTWSQYALNEAGKLRIKYTCMASGDSKTTLAEINSNVILDFFINVFKGPPVFITVGHEVHELTSLSLTTEDSRQEQYYRLDQSMCKKCNQRRSNENVYNYLKFSESYGDIPLGSTFYEPVLGCANMDVFGDCGSEYEFNLVQDKGRKYTEIKCTVHESIEVNDYFSQPFRTRVRSKSGPDLRHWFNSNKTSLNRNSSSGYCGACGAAMLRVNDSCNSQRSLSSKPPGEKRSPSKKLCTIFQDLFSPIRRLNESLSHDHRKSLLRTWSKKQK